MHQSETNRMFSTKKQRVSMLCSVSPLESGKGTHGPQTKIIWRWYPQICEQDLDFRRNIKTMLSILSQGVHAPHKLFLVLKTSKLVVTEATMMSHWYGHI